MRYEDASGSFSAATGNPDARDDTDVLAAGSRGPATGNAITGAGTLTGQAGADVVADGSGKIVALEGANGSDTSDGGSLQVAGRFGELSMDANGNYRYQPNGETPEGARDVFRYTLADNAGARDAATLTIELGREPKKIDANAQQIVPGPDGVVTLPPGVELSDIQVVGRNLVITLPDGSQMVIIDGAVFVPQLVLNGVEVPATNLAALLIDAEPQPAGGIPQSSGGNFDIPVPPLDPGVPLGDLIPPTELHFPEPIFEEIGDILDRDPEAGAVSVQLDDDAKAGGNPGTPAVGDDADSVNATGFLPGSGGDGSLAWDLSSGGAPAGFSYVDGPNGSILVQQVQNAINVTVLTITVDANTGAYTVVQNAAILHPTLDGQAGDNTENNLDFVISYTVTDDDGDVAIGTLTVNVDDDTPTVTVAAGSDAEVILTTHDAATIGAASEAVSTTANFSGVFSGTTVSPGADGAGSGTTSGYVLSTTGGASGLTQGGVAINLYNVGGVIVGSTAATAGAIDASNTVFTVSTTNTGIVTLTQFSQIDHTNTDPSPTGAPFTDHIISLTDGSITLTRSETVVDRDGNSVTGSASVGIGANLRFVDDGPTIGLADRGEDQLIVDESDFPTNATGNFAANFSANFGADGPAVGGGIGYSLGINAGATGLVDTLTGQAVVLSVVGGQVVGTAGAGGPVVFVVSVNSSGVVTLDQQRAVVHDDPADHDEPGASAATLNADNLITLTATATDRDGDTASQLINIGRNLHFEDDGPNVSNLTPGPGVILDETTGAIAGTAGGMTPISATSASAVISATSAFGADGPAAVGATVYGLSLSGGGATIASGLQTAVGDFAITLNLVDSTHITGTYNGANIAFTITMNANGTITVQQNVPLEHLIDGSSAAAHDDALDLVLDGEAATNLINATITVTDGDGDTASGSVGIGNLIVFEDDGPSINVSAGPDAGVVLQTQDADTIGGATDTNATSAAFGGVFSATSAGGADGSASVVGTYTLGVSASGVDSGLDQGGNSIFLYVIAGKVVGSTAALIGNVNAGNTVFDVGVSGTGVVTLTQYSQIDHPIAGDPTATGTPFADHILGMADGLVTLTFSSTVTDNDGDTATDSETVNIGANLTFADDGPDISAVLTGTQIRIDETDNVVAAGGETDGPGGNLGTVTMSAVSLFTVSSPHASADAPTTNSYALTLSSQGVASGLLLSTTNDPIFLYNIGGVISGSTAATVGAVNAGNTVFTASINTSTGAITLTQFFAVEHGTPGASHDEDSSGLNAGVLNVTITATDFDGDTDSASVDLGSVIRFEDDGPTIDVTTNPDAGILVQTQDADTIAGATDTASSAVNFGGAFNLTSSGGSDGAANTPSLSYSLGVSAPGVDSGLDQTGNSIFLHVIGGKVVGSTAALIGNVNAGNTVFDVGVSATGVVTLTQYSQIDHPIAGDPTPSGTPFADHIIAMTDSLVTLTASSSITDNDGDIATDSATINIGNNLQFADHGPTATNDVDSIAPGFFGTATGNVLTGVEVAVPEDTNASDGNADNVGADAPGAISLIASNNVPANTDNTPDGSGNFVVAGQYGVLTINANGDYSYDRNDGSAGGVSDVFTYTLRDFDGDTVTATLTINIGVNPPVATTASAAVDDDGLGGANAAGTNDINANTFPNPDDLDGPASSEATFRGQLGVTGGDGDIDFSLIAPVGPVAIGQETVTFSFIAGVLTATIATSPGAGRVGNPLFTVALDGESGEYIVTLVDNVLHNNDANEDEDGSEVSVNIQYQVVDVGGNPSATPGTLTIVFNDDVATIDVTKGADAGVVLQTQDADTIGGATDTNVTTANFGGVFGLTSSAGADGAPAPVLGYTLGVPGAGVNGVDSGLDQTGANIYLHVIGGKVVGSTSLTLAGVNAGNTVFDVGVSGTGVVTLTQYSQIDHPIAGDPTATGTPFADHIIGMADALITLTASSTITDNDGDSATDSETVNIGANLTFADDGPDISAVLTGTQIRIDETDGVVAAGGEVDPAGGNLGTVTMSAVSLFTVSSPHASADAPTTNSYALTLSSQGVASGLLLSTTNDPIFLYNIGGVISGSTAATVGAVNAGNTVFTASINTSTGAIILTQFFAVEHGTPGASHDEDSSGLNAGVLNVTITATDFDGDTDSASVDLGSVIRFEDDGPTIDVTKGADAGVVLQTQDIDTIGGLTDTHASSANFGGVFAIGTSSGGSDGAASAPVLGYTLGVSAPGVDSGLDQGGASIFLHVIAGKVVGSTAALIGNVNAGNTVFDVGVSATGVVTLTQYSQIDHTNVDPTPTGTPFADHIISMADALITLTASSTITDNDGDTQTDSETVNIGANLTFADDGPDISAVLTGTQIRIDETDGVVAAGGEVDPVGGNLGTVTMTLASLVTLSNPHVSADAPTTNVYSLVLSSQGVASGLLESTGNQPIFLYNMGGGVIAGSTAASVGLVDASNTAFTVSINPGTGAVTMTQFQGIEHPTAPSSYDEDSSGLTAGVLNLVATATDFDGDTDSAQVDLGSVIRFEDDGPALAFGSANPVTSKTATGSMTLNIGSDDWTPATLVDTFINVTANGGTVGTTPVALTNFVMGAVTANTSSLVTYAFSFSYDSDPVAAGVQAANGTGSITINKGTGQYSVTIDQSVGYSTTVQTSQSLGITGYQAEDPADEQGAQAEFAVSQLAPGFFAQFYGDHNNLGYAGGSNSPFTGDPGYVSVSGSANGVNSDTIQQNDVLNMDFYVADPGGDNTPEQARAFADAVFFQIDLFGNGEDGFVVLKLVDPANPNTIIYRTFQANFDDFYTVDTGSPPGYNFTFDQNDAVLVIEANDYRLASDPVQYVIAGLQYVVSSEGTSGLAYDLNGVTGAGGGLIDLTPNAFGPGDDTDDNDVTKIVNIGLKLTTATPQPITLNFNVTAQDADGDITANVPVSVTFPASVMPVVMDMDGDGAEFLGVDAGVGYDYGSGLVATAWAGPDDGILVRDANGNGTVDDASEFVFGGNGLTDLQALAIQYGSTLDANDADFARFAVWQDANSNGVADAGELVSLTAAGIASISLVSDGVSYEAANGDVTVVGTGSYTNADGSTGALADAIFRTGSAANDDQQLKSITAANNNSVIVAAIAAAGLGASSAAAANDHAPSEPSAVVDPYVVAESSGSGQGSDAGSDDASRSALTGETREAVDAQPQGGSSSHPAEAAASYSLTADDSHAPQEPVALLEGTDASDLSVMSQTSFTSASVGMPSAEMLVAANANAFVLESPANGTAEVGRVLFDALAGGGHGPNLDAVIDAVANQAYDGAHAVIDVLASHGAADVSGWDMASIASFTGGHAAFTMDHMTLHIDAAQAV